VDGAGVVGGADGAGHGRQRRRSARGEGNGGAWRGRYWAGVRRGEVDEGEGRVDGDGRGREFGINGGSSGKDGVNTMGDHRWYSLSYFE
jgi:hypothetical protein